MAFLDADENGFHRENYYMAQIAAEIRRTHLKSADAKRVKTKDFILQFTKAKKQPAVPRMASSKAFWLAIVGIKKEE